MGASVGDVSRKSLRLMGQEFGGLSSWGEDRRWQLKGGYLQQRFDEQRHATATSWLMESPCTSERQAFSNSTSGLEKARWHWALRRTADRLAPLFRCMKTLQKNAPARFAMARPPSRSFGTRNHATLLPLPKQNVPSRGWGEDFWVRVSEREGKFLKGTVDNPLYEARLHGCTRRRDCIPRRPRPGAFTASTGRSLSWEWMLLI